MKMSLLGGYNDVADIIVEVFTDDFWNRCCGCRINEPGQYCHFIREGYATVFNTMRETMRLVKTAVSDMPRFPRIMWCAEGQYQELVLTGKNVKVSLSDLRFCSATLMDSIERQLSGEVSFGLDLLHHLRTNVNGEGTLTFMDNMAETSVGYSFLTDAANGLEKKYLLVIQEILRNPNFRSSFIKHQPNGAEDWNRGGMRSWLMKCSQLQKEIFTAIHLTSGQPGRGEEIAQVHFANTAEVDRGLFWAKSYETLMLVTYHYDGKFSSK